ncbi:hypothetical protein KAR91_47195, partial [Candidatus Pacearchaeota archaeon]|nr:hypothetical protein [Candidatus Pacearchaeota archaeon]
MADDIIQDAEDSGMIEQRQINSMIDSVAKVRADMEKKFSSVESTSQKVSSLTNKNIGKISTEMSGIKRQVGKQQATISSVANQRGIKDYQQGVNNTMRKMGVTLDHLAAGVKKVTVETGRVTKESLGQYSKAISEDISINKQNTVAMAMAKSSPLFGYFASKFMETDIYQGFAGRIKDKFSAAANEVGTMLKSVGRGTFEKLKDMRFSFGRGQKVEYSEESQRAMGRVRPSIRGMGEKLRDRNEQRGIDPGDKERKRIRSKLPHFAEGGVVKKSGRAVVHKGEVITDIDDFFKRMDERLVESASSTKISAQALEMLTIMSKKRAEEETYIGDFKKSRQGFVKDFIQAYKKGKDVEGKTLEQRMARSILELKVALIGQTDRMKLAWQDTLMKHPTLRNIITIGQGFKAMFDMPFRLLFSARGGYIGRIKAATRSKNVFSQIVGALSLMYTDWSLKFDTMKSSLKSIETSMTGGERRKDTKDQTWTIFDKAKDFMEGEKDTGPKKPLGETLWKLYARSIDLDEDSLARAGIKSFQDIKDPKAIMKKAGVTPENLQKHFGASTVRDVGENAAFDLKMAFGQAKKKGLYEFDKASGATKKKAEEVKEKIAEKVDKMLFNATYQAVVSKKKYKSKIKKVDRQKLAEQTATYLTDFVTAGRDLVKKGKKKGGAAIDWLKSKTSKTKLPKFAAGGTIKETGKAIVHKGEVIMPIKKLYAFMDSVQHNIQSSRVNLANKKGEFEQNFWTKRRLKIEEKFDTIQAKARDKWEKRFAKGWSDQDALHEKNTKKTQKTFERFMKFADKRQRVDADKHREHLKKSDAYDENLRYWGIRKRAKLEDSYEVKRAKGTAKIHTNFLKEEAKSQYKFSKKATTYQKKVAKQTIKDQKKIEKTNRAIQAKMVKQQKKFEKDEEKRQTKFSKQMDKMRKKELKFKKKIEKMENKIRTEEMKYDLKIAKMQAKTEGKERLKMMKAEMKVKFIEAKMEAKEKRATMKDEMKIKKMEMKEKRAQLKIDIVAKKKEMKIRAAEMKEEVKKRKVLMKERMQELKAKQKEQRSRLWKNRWKRVTDFPQQMKTAQENVKKQFKARNAIARAQLQKLSKISKYTGKLTELFPTFAKMFKKLRNNFWPILMMIGGAVSTAAKGIMSFLPAIVAGITTGFGTLALLMGGKLLKAAKWAAGGITA